MQNSVLQKSVGVKVSFTKFKNYFRLHYTDQGSIEDSMKQALKEGIISNDQYSQFKTPQTTPMGEQVAPPTPTQGMAGTQAGPSPMGDESQKGVVPGFRRIRKPGWEDSTSSYAFTYEHMPTGQIWTGNLWSDFIRSVSRCLGFSRF